MSRFGKGALLMILSALGFSAMQIAIAKTAQGIPLFEQLFFATCLPASQPLSRCAEKIWQPLASGKTAVCWCSARRRAMRE